MKRLLYVAGIMFSIAGLTACSQTSKGEQMNHSKTSTSQTSSTETGVGISVLVAVLFIFIPKQFNP